MVERLRSHAGYRTRPAVVHEGGEVLVQIRGAEVLDRGHDRGVQAGPPAGAQLGGQRVGDEGVREPQPRRTGGVLDEQAGVDRRVEGVERVRGRQARDVREHVELDRDAQHRRAGEQRLGGGRQHADAAADDVEGRARHPGGAGGVHVGEAVLARQQLDHLPDEERVSSGALVDVVGHLGADRAVAAPAEPRADVGVGQAVQVDALGTGLAGQLGEAVDQRRRRVRRDGPDGRQQQHRHRGQGAGHELERPQRRGIGPLEVVDHEEQGPGGRPHRGDHRGVQRGPVGPRVDRVDAAPGGADAVAGRVADDPRSQELLGDLRVPPVRGRRGALLAPCPGDHEPLRRGLGHQLLGQAGLADARLAADDHRPPGAGRGLAGRLAEPRELGRPPDHGHPAPRAVGGPRPTARDDGGGARGARGGARGRRLQVRGVRQDVGLELAQLGSRLDADLLGEDAPGLRERPQRVGLAPGPVEGERQVAAEPLVERVGGDGRLERPHELAGEAERQLCLEGAVEGVGVDGLDPGCGVGHPRLARQLGQQRTVESERLVVALGRGRMVAGRQRGGGRQPEVVEACEVDDVPLDRQPVPARLGDEDDVPAATRPSGLELPPELGHVGLKGGGGPWRRARAPHLVDQPLGGHGPVEVEQQRGEDRPLLPPAEVGGAAVLALDGEPAEEAEPPRATGGIGHGRPSVPATRVGPVGGIRPSCGPGRHEEPGGRGAHVMTTNRDAGM